jgi:hypothetical protein
MDSNTLPAVLGLWIFLGTTALVIGWLAWKFGSLNRDDQRPKSSPLKPPQAGVSR